MYFTDKTLIDHQSFIRGISMSAKEKMKKIAETINTKTKEYAPIFKEKLLIAYTASKNFTINVAIPKMKQGVETLKTKISDFQAKKKAAHTTNTTEGKINNKDKKSL